jgi:hypothetical protein
MREHPEMVGKPSGNGVPGAGMLEIGMQEYNGWRVRVAPVPKVEAQPIQRDGFVPHQRLGARARLLGEAILRLLYRSSSIH